MKAKGVMDYFYCKGRTGPESARRSRYLRYQEWGQELPLLTFVLYFVGGPRTADSVFGASTSAKIAHIFVGTKKERRGHRAVLRHFAVDLLKIRLEPAHAGERDLAVGIDPEDGRDVGQAVGTGHRVRDVIGEHREGDAELTGKGRRILRVILRDSNQ